MAIRLPRSPLHVALTFALLSPVACSGQIDTGGGTGGGDECSDQDGCTPTAGDTGGTGGTGGGGGGGGECTTYEGECMPGEHQDCDSGFSPSGNLPNVIGDQTCMVDSACKTTWGGCQYNTPIVLSFDGKPVEIVADPTHGFDLNGAVGVVTDWVSPRTPWLALDRNGNGLIDDGKELFGSMTPLAGGGQGRNGFTALRELDADGDGHITPLDPGFAGLVLWSDRNGDRRSSTGELTSAASARIVSIDVAYTSEPSCDARGNCAIERAAFHYIDEQGALRAGVAIDVHFGVQR